MLQASKIRLIRVLERHRFLLRGSDQSSPSFPSSPLCLPAGKRTFTATPSLLKKSKKPSQATTTNSSSKGSQSPSQPQASSSSSPSKTDKRSSSSNKPPKSPKKSARLPSSTHIPHAQATTKSSEQRSPSVLPRRGKKDLVKQLSSSSPRSAEAADEEPNSGGLNFDNWIFDSPSQPIVYPLDFDASEPSVSQPLLGVVDQRVGLDDETELSPEQQMIIDHAMEGHLYTALSRARSLDGLCIRNLTDIMKLSEPRVSRYLRESKAKA